MSNKGVKVLKPPKLSGIFCSSFQHIIINIFNIKLLETGHLSIAQYLIERCANIEAKLWSTNGSSYCFIFYSNWCYQILGLEKSNKDVKDKDRKIHMILLMMMKSENSITQTTQDWNKRMKTNEILWKETCYFIMHQEKK